MLAGNDNMKSLYSFILNDWPELFSKESYFPIY